MKLKSIILYSVISYLGFLNISVAQNAHDYLQDGDDQYNANNYLNAEIYYRKAKEKESTLKSNYNLGNATYQLGRYEEAVEYYQNATAKANDKLTRSDAYYNLGNAYFNNQKLEEASEAFKNAIKENPANKNARYNLAVTKEMLKQMAQQQQQQQNQDQQDNQEQQENQEQQDQEQQNDQNQQGENQEQEEKENEEQEKQEEQEQDSTQQSQPMSFDSSRLDKQSLDSIDAQNLLKIIQDEEMKVQEKLRKFNSKRKKPDKDW